MQYFADQLAELTGGKLICNAYENKSVTDILIDSRLLINPENCIFIALVTKKNNGHHYIQEAFDKGVRNFMISDPAFVPEQSNTILVPDTLVALQKMAAHHRKNFNIPVIGITGSNGKTIIKEWLFQLLSEDYYITRSPKSYNSQVGVPLSVLQLKEETQLGIFEAGLSEPDEMEKLQSIINPDIGIFTNIGPPHSENFINLRQKAGEKLKLFTKVKTLIYCPDYPDIQETVIKSELLRKIKPFTWSHKQEASLKITHIIRNNDQTTDIKGIFNKKEINIKIPFRDDASVENAIHCWATMLYLGYKNNVVAGRMINLQPVAMRLELKEGINHCTIINDSYNSDINSLTIALNFMNQQNQHRRKTVILSDILQSGMNDNELYGEIALLLKQKGIDRVIGIGNAMAKQANQFEIEKYFFPTTTEFITRFSFAEFQNETILVKGARIFEFEQISQALQQKAHETVLEINLNALVNNLNHYRKKLDPETAVMAMVKAFSYGSGSFEIANVLQYHRIDYLAVAYPDEGVELRKAGIKTPIMVMNPDEQGFDAIIKHNLEPEIYNFRSLHLLREATVNNIIPDNKPVKIHLKLDTGMHRLGFAEDEIESLIMQLKDLSMIYVQSVFSHLASAENPADDEFTNRQVRLFEGMADEIKNKTGHPVQRHILNSAGISRFPEHQFEMVRLGIGLYGIPSTPDEAGALENVGTLRSTISQIRKVRKGETIGYNRSWTAEKNMELAIVPIGYADGLSRRLSNGKGVVYIGNKPAPVVGNICMDMCMVDVTEIGSHEGDEVIVFGKDHPISELAERMETIPYEVLTNISRRVKRVYFHE
jgi:Alr-MurF fusion protein